MKILSIAPKAYVGVNAVFEHLTPLIGSEHTYLEDLHFAQETAYDLYIFGGWVPNTYPMLFNWLNQRDDRGPKIAVLNCSSMGQMEMAKVEIDFLQLMFRYAAGNVIDYVFLGDSDAAVCFADQPGVHYFPYPIRTKIFEEHRVPLSSKIPGAIGLFSPAHYRKNLVNQLLACKLATEAYPDLNLHSNLQVEVGGVQKQYHGWLPRDQYFQKIAEMQATLHCGFTESFCYAAMESIMLRTLPILSPVIANNFCLNNADDYQFMVVDTDSPSEISYRIKLLLEIQGSEQYIDILHKTMRQIEDLALLHKHGLEELFKTIESEI